MPQWHNEGDAGDYVQHADTPLYITEFAPQNLSLNCVVPHSLDDQWIPRRLLQEIVVQGRSLEDIAEERQDTMRAEYVRALLSAREVVINRAYLYRTPVIVKDYLTPGQQRDAFEELLSDRAIISFVLRERSPIEPLSPNEIGYSKAFAAWEGICRRAQVCCVRLDWTNDKANESLISKHFESAFTHGIMNGLGEGIRPFLEDTGAEASDDAIEDFRSVMTTVQSTRPTSSSGHAQKVKRTTIYERFVLTNDSSTSTPRYDRSRRWTAQVKWFADLIYNNNLAKALGRALVTPVDTPHWSAVRPVNAREADSDFVDLPAIAECVVNALFYRRQGSDPLAPFRDLTLTDVVSIRRGEVWRSYARAMDNLLKSPWHLANPERGLVHVYRHYDRLVDFISST